MPLATDPPSTTTRCTRSYLRKYLIRCDAKLPREIIQLRLLLARRQPRELLRGRQSTRCDLSTREQCANVDPRQQPTQLLRDAACRKHTPQLWKLTQNPHKRQYLRLLVQLQPLTFDPFHFFPRRDPALNIIESETRLQLQLCLAERAIKLILLHLERLLRVLQSLLELPIRGILRRYRCFACLTLAPRKPLRRLLLRLRKRLH